MARLQFGHQATHVLHALGTDLGLDRKDRRRRLRFVHLLRQEAFDHGDLCGFLVGQLLATAFDEHVDRFAALLDHFLQHFDDQSVVALGCLAIP